VFCSNGARTGEGSSGRGPSQKIVFGSVEWGMGRWGGVVGGVCVGTVGVGGGEVWGWWGRQTEKPGVLCWHKTVGARMGHKKTAGQGWVGKGGHGSKEKGGWGGV